MRITRGEGTWSVVLERKDEAAALLAAQASPVGNEAMSTTDPLIDRVAIGRKAVELLRFAELMLPDDSADPEGVTFLLPESQHLSSLMYGVSSRPELSASLPDGYGELLADLHTQVDSFFGMAE